MEFIANMDPLMLGLIVGLFTVAMLFSGIPIITGTGLLDLVPVRKFSKGMS